jgi:uncharacterized protein (TIGR02300 family)
LLSATAHALTVGISADRRAMEVHMHHERGVKRVCAHCSTRFYDLLAKPVCPKCGAEFIIPEPPKPRRATRPIPQVVEPAPIAAGSADDLPENDDEENAAPADEDDSDQKEAEDEAEAY